MPSHAFEIDPHSLTLTVRDPGLIEEAEGIAESIGVSYTSRTDGKLVIRCTNIEDLALLGDLLAFRTN